MSLKGTAKWTIDDDEGVAHTFLIPDTYYNQAAPYRLLSPQHLAQVLNDNEPSMNGTTCMTLADEVVLEWNQRSCRRTVPLNSSNNVALLRSSAGFEKFQAFCTVIQDDEEDYLEQAVGLMAEPFEVSQEMGHPGESREADETVIDPQEERRHPDLPDNVFEPMQEKVYCMQSEDEMDPVVQRQSEVLAWHYRLGHLSFAKIKAMAERGDLPARLANCEKPRCAACLYGKATRKPWRSKPNKSAILKDLSLPGELVAIDQMVSSTPGLVPQMKGFLTSKRYTAASVFVDVYSNYSFVFFHKTISSEETIEAKQAFERHAAKFGISVKAYRADNGICETQAFQQEVERNGQMITYSGVGAHHQNAKAEKKIRDLQDMSRSMLLHAAIRWSDAITANLWPFSMRMANDVINASPTSTDTISPIEQFSGTNVLPKVKHWHTFGAPAYVLDTRLETAGGKINKWQERARIGIYLGSSPRHSRTVALILSLQTGHVSPQFHVTVDDFFETMRTDEKHCVPKSLWQAQTKLLRLPGKKASDQIVDPINIPSEEDKDSDAHEFEPDVFEDAVMEEPEPDPVLEAEAPEPVIPDDPPQGEQLVQRRRGARAPVERAQYVTRSGRTVKPTQRWTESLEQQRQGLVALYVSWEVFNDGGYEIQEQLTDPIAFAASNNPDIMYVEQALKEPDAPQFRAAMEAEVQAHVDGEHWVVIEKNSLPEGTKVLPAVWAMRRKRRIITDEVYKWKARLNLHGGKQEHGVNYWETYSPVVAWPTIRLFLILILLSG